MTFPIGCGVSLLLKDFAFKHIIVWIGLETVFEKSQVFNLVDSKLASAFDGDLFGFEHLR